VRKYHAVVRWSVLCSMYKLSASEIRTFADITKCSQNTHLCTVYSICVLFRGYHTAVFISACISSPSVDHRGIAEGS